MRPIALLTALATALVLPACGGDNVNNNNPPDAGNQDADTPDADPLNPQIASADYPVIAHGGRLILAGTNLAGATEVDIGGVVHTDILSADSSVTVASVLDATPVGEAVEVTVTTPLGTSAPFEVAVIHLIISEVEVDSPQPNVTTRDFVELDTGVGAALSLDGYVLVLYNGTTGVPVEALIDLDADTADTGLMLIGPAALVSTPQIAFEQEIQNGEDAVAVYQFAGDPASFPANLAAAGTDGLIDALAYDSNGDGIVPAALTELTTDTVEPDEGPTSEARDTVSIQRCPSDVTRRLGASYRLEIPTPGRANVNCDAAPVALADCTIDFDATCPNVVAGECGAIFVGDAGNACDDIGGADCVSANDGYHVLAANNRLDIFLTGNLDTLDTLLAPFQGTDATMTFFTLDGTQVGAQLTVADDCNGTAAAVSTADLGAGAVRRIQVTGDADIYIDAFRTNP